jgi:hypothetical protein
MGSVTDEDETAGAEGDTRARLRTLWEDMTDRCEDRDETVSDGVSDWHEIPLG